MTDIAMQAATRRVAKTERIAALDVLRGFAILAILMMNIPYMGGYANFDFFDPRAVSWTLTDQVAFRFIGTVFDGTQRGLLELLFGAGIMIMTRAALQPDGPVAVADLHFRRNIWLIVFGAFQALVLMWPGDILLPYGVVAIFAFPARTLKPRWKALAGVVFLLVAITPNVQRYQADVTLRAQAAAAAAKVAAHKSATKDEQAAIAKWNDKVAAQLPIAQSPKKKAAFDAEKKARLGPLPAYAAFLRGIWINLNFNAQGLVIWSEMLGGMLLGMALYDWGVIQGRRSGLFYLGLLVAGYGAGMPLRWLADSETLKFTADPKPLNLTWDIARIALTLGHIGLFNLALKSSVGRRVLSVFQAPGRMPLTIYLSASIICMWIIFPGVGLRQFGRYGWGGLEAIALAIMAGQLVFANVWMAAFESGPIDWVWKSLAYRKPQPFLKPRVTAGAAAPAAAE